MIYISLSQSLREAVHQLAEKIAALMAEDYLAQRAARGSRAKFDVALDCVSNLPPERYDQLDSI